MRDSEVVAAIAAGDSAGLAEAYDRYAGPLYSFCRRILREPADAADVVQDTFVIAWPRMSALRDPERLRPWLYTVARNECLRRLRGLSLQARLEEAPEVTDEAADVAAGVEQAELCALVRQALPGVGPAEQEVLELQLRHGLASSEVASVLGVSRNHAHALMSRARVQLEAALGALVVARSGRRDCPELDALLGGWDGRLTVLLRKRVSRHVERCAICARRRKQELTPSMLLGVAPVLALPLAAALPGGLRDQVMQAIFGSSPAAVAHRAAVGRTPYSFGHHGFPQPLHSLRPPWWQQHAVHYGAAAGTAAVIAAGVTFAALPPHHHPGGHQPGGGPAATASGTSPVAGGTSPAAGVPIAGGAPRASVVATVGTGVTPGADVTPGAGTPGAGTPGAGTPGAGTPGAGTPGASTPGPSPGAAHPPVSPSAPASATASASATGSTTGAGTLTVSPATLEVHPPDSGTITLTASGGPVSWTVSEPPGMEKKVVVAPMSGTLPAGGTATITVTLEGSGKPTVHLTFSPGGAAVTVDIN
jgi:RNA polymerase sigma factor (sigma-70 family)